MLQEELQGRIQETLGHSSIQVIGAGGIGSMLLHALGRATSVVFPDRLRGSVFDADEVEEKNLSRQLFSQKDIGHGKSRALCRRLEDFLDLYPVEEYIADDNINSLGDGLIFMCVDNHATRKIVSDRCQELENVVLISGGNELWDGTVQCYVRIDGEDITPPLTFGHPEIENPQDELPSCADLAESEPQMGVTNFMAAAWMLAAYWALYSGKLWHELHFDILEGAAASFDFWESLRDPPEKAMV